MTALDKIKEITAFLETCGIEDAHIESEIILTHSLNIDKTGLYKDNPVLSEENTKEIDKILERRAKREPLQYIIGYIEFCGLKIKVGQGVLIPRPETELLVEEVIKLFTAQGARRKGQDAELRIPQPELATLCLKPYASRLTILDLCTGSGCLALALAKEFPEADVYGTDISKTALKYAKENAEINRIRNVTFLQGSLFEPFSKLRTLASGESPRRRNSELFTFDLIVSNPPYIKTNNILALQPEIKEWEPVKALDGGVDGLKYYRDIISDARQYLKEGGFLFFEAGQGQAGDIVKIAERQGFKNISVKKDYAHIERIVSMSFPFHIA